MLTVCFLSSSRGEVFILMNYFTCGPDWAQLIGVSVLRALQQPPDAVSFPCGHHSRHSGFKH